MNNEPHAPLSPTQPLNECTIIIFGATGDLSKRKLTPALYNLIKQQHLQKVAIIGVSFDSTNIPDLLEASRPFIADINNATWQELTQAYHYHQMDFHDSASYELLKDLIKSVEMANNLRGNRIFYFATMPNHFSIITENLVQYGIVKQSKHVPLLNEQPWTRLVYEKPFGSDLASSDAMNAMLHNTFNEHQIFRIDHFLGKELTGNIALARFTNRIFEPLWNNEHIESVHITASETLGIGNRGRYYDSYGALKDMIQSHLLQLLALTAMEKPPTLTANHIRNAKAAVLAQVALEDAVLGQYEGYTDEEYVANNSTTDTFAALKLFINNTRWQGVPFYLSSGKFLQKKESTIVIVFKMAECLLTHCPSQPNTLTIKIYPDDGIYLGLNAKIPGQSYEVAPVSMDFCHSCLFGPNTPEAYEVLLTDVIKGDQAAFIRADEVTLSWNIIEQIKKLNLPVHSYARQSNGPAALKNFYKKKD